MWESVDFYLSRFAAGFRLLCAERFTHQKFLPYYFSLFISLVDFLI
nr:MAG TPA: hypothetical protein [Caudoviricetes sp.]